MYKTLFGCINNFIIYTPINHNTKNKNYKHKPYEKRVREDNCVLKPVNLPPRIWRKCHTTFSNGCLGSHNDEERSEMRYVMRIAYLRESSNLWTHIALPGYAREYAYLSVRKPHSTNIHCLTFVVLRWTLGLGENVKTFLPLLKFRALRDNTWNAVQSSPLMVMLFTRLLFIIYAKLLSIVATVISIGYYVCTCTYKINFHSDLKLSKKTRWI